MQFFGDLYESRVGYLQDDLVTFLDPIDAKFAEVVAPKPTTLFSDISSLNTLPESIEGGNFVLIPKPGKDPQECASYKPIIAFKC